VLFERSSVTAEGSKNKKKTTLNRRRRKQKVKKELNVRLRHAKKEREKKEKIGRRPQKHEKTQGPGRRPAYTRMIKKKKEKRSAHLGGKKKWPTWSKEGAAKQQRGKTNGKYPKGCVHRGERADRRVKTVLWVAKRKKRVGRKEGGLGERKKGEGPQKG